MKTPLTFLLALTFLFLFGCQTVGGNQGSFYEEDMTLRSLAEEGFANSQLMLGSRYYHGEGVPQDYQEALKWFRLAAEQGYADAQSVLGHMYRGGKGVPQDFKQAVRLFRLSAEQGHALGQTNLGFMYANGQGVPQDYVSAHMWWNLAGSNGNKDAVKNRNILEKKMTKQQIEKAQEMARNWKPKK